ncbi:hypothetical protein OG948_34540 (plasmid) [Embleya sp. NBC_00888]|uniref:hypothetical protein n=1 Tax=Embleya sp. NBC_00888 TaxID=2975960 RepID=UPI002F90803F|nr:hypothetical protein OG948_34540 [Embleya sp. NBC_00888]
MIRIERLIDRVPGIAFEKALAGLAYEPRTDPLVMRVIPRTRQDPRNPDPRAADPLAWYDVVWSVPGLCDHGTVGPWPGARWCRLGPDDDPTVEHLGWYDVATVGVLPRPPVRLRAEGRLARTPASPLDVLTAKQIRLLGGDAPARRFLAAGRGNAENATDDRFDWTAQARLTIAMYTAAIAPAPTPFQFIAADGARLHIARAEVDAATASLTARGRDAAAQRGAHPRAAIGSRAAWARVTGVSRRTYRTWIESQKPY